MTVDCFNMICNVCVALGGLGTVGTLACMICDLKKKRRQIETTQKIQSQQLEALYRPDIRVDAWKLSQSSESPVIILGNHGEDITICSIKENPAEPNGILNMDGMTNWFPYQLRKGEQIHIPLLKDAFPTKGKHEIELEVENRLGTRYACQIEAEGEKVVMRQIYKL